MLEKMLKANKNQLIKYHISADEGEVFVISLSKVIEERCDELDYEIEANNYEILHREYKRVATSIYDYEVYFTRNLSS